MRSRMILPYAAISTSILAYAVGFPSAFVHRYMTGAEFPPIPQRVLHFVHEIRMREGLLSSS